MDKKTKGDVAEMAVASKLIEEGYKVLIPIGENHRYDLAAEKEGRFIRVQVKYVTPKNGALEVNCRSSNNWSVLPYTSEEIDAIIAYNGVDKSIYFIPVNKINQSSFKLRLDKPKNNQKQRINLASDFINFDI